MEHYPSKVLLQLATARPNVVIFFLIKSFFPKEKNKGFGLRGFNEAPKACQTQGPPLVSLPSPKARQPRGPPLVSLASPRAHQTQGLPLVSLASLNTRQSQGLPLVSFTLPKARQT